MKAQTIYQALRKCDSWKRMFAANRDMGTYGIAVGTDSHALRWQRYDRLARKLDKRLVAILTAYDNEHQQAD